MITSKSPTMAKASERFRDERALLLPMSATETTRKLVRSLICALAAAGLGAMGVAAGASSDVVSPRWGRVIAGVTSGTQRILYAGACNYSVPAFGDVDGDGDLDMLIGQQTGGPVFVRNDGTPRAPEWTIVNQGNPVPDMAIVEGAPPARTAPALADFDGDGLLDLIVGKANGRISYYHNTGTRVQPRWTLATPDWIDTAEPPANVRPALVDIDGDGLLELFVGADGGTIAFYRYNIQAGLWQQQSSFFSGIDVIQDAAPAFGDIDGDGDYDLFVGNGAGQIVFYRNFGTPALGFFRLEPSPLAGMNVGANAAPVLSDINHNGTFDLFVGSQGGGILFLQNAGTVERPAWKLGKPIVGGIDVGNNSAPEYADIDRDGDLDMFVASGDPASPGSIFFYLNVGTRWLPNWQLEDRNFAGIGEFEPVPRFVDIDGDGDLDLYVGISQGSILFHWNQGTPQDPIFTRQSAGDIPQPGYFVAKPFFADMDGDGDYDLWVGCFNFGTGMGEVLYYKNTGTRYAPDFTSPPEPWPSLAFGDAPAPASGDVDGDGLKDLVIGGTPVDGGPGVVRYYHCALSTPTLVFDPPTTFTFFSGERNPIPTLADLDGNLRPDLLVGGNLGGVSFYRNPSPNVAIFPFCATVKQGGAIDFVTSPPVAGGVWAMDRNDSGGGIVPSTGHYRAGYGHGTDTIRFNAAGGVLGVAYVNVLTDGQIAAAGKAVIMAGRKSSDTLWPTTNDLANQIYRTLLYKGFARENIRYLNPVVNQDVDGNGFQDDITAASSFANIQDALTAWADGAPKLFVYLIDHGEERNADFYVRCNETDVLYASQLDTWLDQLQSAGTGLVCVTADCCESGGFLAKCHATGTQQRIVISSTNDSQPAYFTAGGQISFTYSFISALYLGRTIGEAFDQACGAMGWYQTPQLDDTGDGVYDPGADGALAQTVSLGVFGVSGPDGPQIAEVCPNQRLTTTTAAAIWASGVSSPNPIVKVWAAISAPELNPLAQLTPTTPVLSVPQVELAWNEALQRYEAVSNVFKRLGYYQVTVFARDNKGGVSYPKQTYVIRGVANEKMVLVCGNGAYDSDSPWEFSNHEALMVHDTAIARFLTDDDITYLTASTSSTKDGAPTKLNLQNAIDAGKTVGQLDVYLIGKGNATAFDIDGDGADADDVTPANLKGWLDTLQTTNTRVVVILDFVGSGSWVTALAPPPTGKSRVVVSSCGPGEASWCESGGVVSFTQYFFNRILIGSNVRNAFNMARAAMRAISSDAQNAQLDDDGNGVSDKNDGTLAQHTFIGAAFSPGDNAPTIGSYAQMVVLTSSSATLWASGVWADNGIARVFAKIIPAGASPTGGPIPEVDLVFNDDAGRWDAIYEDFDPSKTYQVVYLARDKTGVLSRPYRGIYGPATAGGGDLYDRLFGDATPATLNFVDNRAATAVQAHNLWSPGDVDWAMFNVDAAHAYTVTAGNQGPNCDAIVYLSYTFDPNTPVVTLDDYGAGGLDETYSWFSPVTGTMLVKVTQSPDSSDSFGPGTSYTLSITGDWGDSSGLSTISPMSMASIGPSGGVLSAGASGVYTQHSVTVPSGAMSDSADFIMDSTGDVGNSPYYGYTSAWLSAHANNASITQIACAAPVALSSNATVAIEFLNNGTVFPGFPITDKPTSVDPNDMRIYTWTGSAWTQLPGLQTVSWNSGTAKGTVTGSVSALGSVGHELGYYVSLFAVAQKPATPTPSPSPSSSPSPSPSPTPSPTPGPTPTSTPTSSPSPSPTPNAPPNTPANVSPANGATGVSLTPTLQSSPFSDPNGGDTHAASQWQVRAASSPGDYSVKVYDSGSSASKLTSCAVPAGYLAESTTYYWRVKHRDNHLVWSAWSTETNFTAQEPPPSIEKVRDYLVGRGTLTPSEMSAADFNMDGKIDIADIIYRILH